MVKACQILYYCVKNMMICIVLYYRNSNNNAALLYYVWICLVLKAFVHMLSLFCSCLALCLEPDLGKEVLNVSIYFLWGLLLRVWNNALEEVIYLLIRPNDDILQIFNLRISNLIDMIFWKQLWHKLRSTEESMCFWQTWTLQV